MRNYYLFGFILLLLQSCGNTPQISQTNVEPPKPSELVESKEIIKSEVQTPTLCLIKGVDNYWDGSTETSITLLNTLKSEPYNPKGYKIYFNKKVKDDYGNISIKKEFIGGTYMVTKRYYDELQKFRSIDEDVYNRYIEGVQGTKKGWEMYLVISQFEPEYSSMGNDISKHNEIHKVDIPY